MNIIESYAREVVAGTVPAGKFHRLACVRHLRDLERVGTPGFPYRFDLAKADRFFAFAEKLKHYKGEWSGQSIVLQPYQKFRLGSIFGWVHATTGFRRFRNAYNELPRKQGKSLEAAVVSLYVTFFDGEPGAEGYCAAPLALDTPIPTPSGWTTMGELRVGDEVFDEQGQPARVEYLSPIVQDSPCFEMLFHDGSRIVADAAHRWQTLSVLSGMGSLAGRSRADWYGTGVALRSAPSVRTTAEIASTLRTVSGFRNHCIEVTAPLVLPERELPIPPYTLGVWLGDGRVNRGAIVCHENDREILDYISVDGFTLSPHCSQPGLVNATILGLRTKLRALDLLENKHVPEIYLRGSIRQRQALLQGLMDTDGTCTKTGECRFTNRNRRLAEAVHELANSLGLLAHLREITVEGAPHYVVTFKAQSDTPVFALRRKYDRQRQRIHPRARRRYVDEVRPVDSVPVRCIAVDASSHLFLVGRGMIPTHNTKRDQASIVFNDAKRLVQSSGLKTRIAVQVANLHRDDTASKLEPLGADHDSTDGLNPNFVNIDEMHAHKTRGLIDVLETATGARRQPLIFKITTAGDDPVSPCGDEHDYAGKILDGTLEDETYFAFIAHADPEDAWTAETTWRKANPNFGVSVNPEDLRAKVTKAQGIPSAAATFKQKHLNLWVNASAPCLSIDGWRKGQSTWSEAELAHESCYVGIDLSTKIDLCAVSLVFPPTAGRPRWRVIQRIWTPKDTLVDRIHHDRAPYQVWADQGYLLTPDGSMIDHSVVRDWLLEARGRYDIEQIGFDPWHAGTLIHDLVKKDGFAETQVLEVSQTFAGLAQAEGTFKALVLGGEIDANRCPVTAWAVSNVVEQVDGKGNIQFTKKKSRGRIDPVKSITIGMSLALRHVHEQPAEVLAEWF